MKPRVGVDPKVKDRRKVPPSCTPPDPMTLWKHYYIPQSIQSALELLANAPGTSCLIAGGTDLLLEIQQKKHPPVDNLIDINHIPELQELKIDGNRLIIGAAIPLRNLAEADLIEWHAPSLRDACELIAGPQVRNVATLGGNVSHALPAADGMISLMAIQPVVRVCKFGSEREVFLEELFRGPGETTLTKDEILTHFVLPLKVYGQASAFSRIMRPQGVALPILNMAIWLERQGERVSDCRIAIGPAGPVPVLSLDAADQLLGELPSRAVLERCCESILNHILYRSSPRRASMDYRKHITYSLLEDVFFKAWKRTFVEPR